MNRSLQLDKDLYYILSEYMVILRHIHKELEWNIESRHHDKCITLINLLNSVQEELVGFITEVSKESETRFDHGIRTSMQLDEDLYFELYEYIALLQFTQKEFERNTEFHSYRNYLHLNGELDRIQKELAGVLEEVEIRNRF